MKVDQNISRKTNRVTFSYERHEEDYYSVVDFYYFWRHYYDLNYEEKKCIKFQIQQSGLFYSYKTIFETVEIDILSYLKWQKTVILQIWKRQKKMCFCPTKNALLTV